MITIRDNIMVIGEDKNLIDEIDLNEEKAIGNLQKDSSET
jgi:hypothetical protein